MRSRERCLRCGGPVADGVAICHRCNPASLPSPSRTQYHATVFLVVLVTLVLTAGVLIGATPRPRPPRPARPGSRSTG